MGQPSFFGAIEFWGPELRGRRESMVFKTGTLDLREMLL